MKRILIFFMFLSAASWAQNGAYAPVDIVQSGLQQQQLNQNAQAQAAQAALLRQQTALLKQQTEALRQQNELAKQQQQAAILAAKTPSLAIRKPRIDDIDAATGKPRFANYAEYEDAKDEWLIGEALRRFEASRPTAATQKKDAQ
jgi:predicted RecB family endonuclease